MFVIIFNLGEIRLANLEHTVVEAAWRWGRIINLFFRSRRVVR
jgi:hypothetical protein